MPAAWEDLRDRLGRLARQRFEGQPVARIAIYLSTGPENPHARSVAAESFCDTETERAGAIDALTRDTLHDLELAYGDVLYRIEAFTAGAPSDKPSDVRDLTLRGGLNLPGIPTHGTDDQRGRQQDRQNAQFFADAFARASGAGYVRLEAENARAWARNAVLEAENEKLRSKLDAREESRATNELAHKMATDQATQTAALWEKGSALMHTVILSIAGGGKYADGAASLALRELVQTLDSQDLTKMLGALKPAQQVLALQIVKSEMDKQDGAEAKRLAESSIKPSLALVPASGDAAKK